MSIAIKKAGTRSAAVNLGRRYYFTQKRGNTGRGVNPEEGLLSRA